MDGALLLVAANEECPQPQTKEHLMALEIEDIKHIVIIQNKIDLVTKEDALKNYKQIKEFIKGTVAEKAPIIPVSAKYEVNTSYIIEAIEEVIKIPERDETKDPIMLVARSFDVNKPGSEIKKLVGGILGGSLKHGKLRTGDRVEISPGRLVQEKGAEKYINLKTKIEGLRTGGEIVDEVLPGGSIALLTKLDPAIVKGDQLSGTIIGLEGKMPPLWNELKLEPHLLKHVIGSKEEIKVEPIKKGEPLMLNVNSATTAGIVTNLEKNKVHIKLKRSICADEGSKVAISRRIGTRWRLVGWAFIKK